jgi:AcrR family transcriptional regulator
MLTGTVTTATRNRRSERADNTREAILTAAERLFAEHGIAAVSNRQITEAARQGNNAAVAYHFGTKADLVRAIEDKHAGHIEQLRQQKIAETGTSTDLRDWVACLVEPLTTHLAALGNPTWYARFIAQVTTDPTYQRVVTKNALASPTLRQVIEGINRGLPELPVHIRIERNLMTRMMLHHTCAEYERGFAEGRPVPRPDWLAASSGLIDAIVGVWQAPVTPHR